MPNVTQRVDEAFEELLAASTDEVKDVARKARAFVKSLVRDASEEVDFPAKMLVLTYQPGKYKGAVLTVMIHKAHVNILFAKGAEMLSLDEDKLLEGTGKLARHVKIKRAEDLAAPGLRALVKEAAARTPR